MSATDLAHDDDDNDDNDDDDDDDDDLLFLILIYPFLILSPTVLTFILSYAALLFSLALFSYSYLAFILYQAICI